MKGEGGDAPSSTAVRGKPQASGGDVGRRVLWAQGSSCWGRATRWKEHRAGCSDELSTWPGQRGRALCYGQDPGRPLGAAGPEPESAVGAHASQRRALVITESGGHYEPS